MSWVPVAGSLVTGGCLFAQNFASATNTQNETANFALRTRLDYEPAKYGDRTALGWRLAEVASSDGMSSCTVTLGTNPNPRCTSDAVVPLNTHASDYRDLGLSFRGADRKLYNAIWMWDS